MISAEEIRTEESQIRLPDLSGTQLLFGFISALSTVGLLLWAFLELWLFEQ